MIYYSEPEAQELRRQFEKQVLDWPGVTSRRMFGCPAYLVDGKLFAFLVTDGVVITQIRARDREELGKGFETEPFRAGEREIDRWLQVHIPELDRIERVMLMVSKSYETARAY
jgi:hypothetical protein